MSTNHNFFEEKGEPKWNWAEALLLTSLTPYRSAKLAHIKPFPEVQILNLQALFVYVQSREHSPRRRSVTFADREESFDLSKRTLEFDLDEEDEKAVAEETEEEASAREVSELSQKEKTESELDLKTDASPSTPGEYERRWVFGAGLVFAACARACTHAHTQACMHTRVCVRACVCACMCASTHTSVPVHVFGSHPL